MSQKLITCIPNFSEARRPEVIDAIAAAIEQTTDVYILDRHSDDDHNRTVITFVGPPETVGDAAFAGIATASQLIDMNTHTGQHPRLGATDVVPFVPFQEVTLADCVAIAEKVAQRVGEELQIPVYLYEAAARKPERKNLAHIRKGEYEGIKQEIESPARAPDFGPNKMGNAGATVIGARNPLVAFNVYLASDDLAIAGKISKAVRHSSGGLRYVKALGMLVDGLAQVSMNLTDYTRTPIARVVEFIRREAARYGVMLHHTELVGLIPQQALVEAAQWYTQLDQFEPDQILETRIYAAMQAQTRPASFLDQLAADTATPGGGSAAAYAAAMAAGLVCMVSGITIGKKKYAAVQDEMQSLLERAQSLRTDLETAVIADAQAFDDVMAAYRLPKGTDPQKLLRKEAIQSAILQAARIPLDVSQKSVEVMELAAQAARIGNVNAISDAGSALALANAALTSAGLNVRINVADLTDAQVGERLSSELVELQQRAAAALEMLEKALQERTQLTL